MNFIEVRAADRLVRLELNVRVEGVLLHRLESGQASGWIRPSAACAMPLDAERVRHHVDEALAAGYPDADAGLIATVRDASVLPQLSWDDEPLFAEPRTASDAPLGLYPLVNSVARLQQVLAAGVRTVQLRIKRPPAPEPDWDAKLRREVEQAIDLAKGAGALLFVNDHLALALELGAPGVHLGQEDLHALSGAEREALVGSEVALGVSSHSVWELCRARALAPRYIACGPVWATTTKDMPWLPQGEDNLRWWCRAAGAPVVAIGGILAPQQVEQASAWGADGVCIVRGLGERPADVLPQLQAALERGVAARTAAAPEWLHPTLRHPETRHPRAGGDPGLPP